MKDTTYSMKDTTHYICEFWKPLVHRLPFGYGNAMKLLGGHTYTSDNDFWKGERQFRAFYDRRIKANIWVDMADFTRREHYFTGRYYDKQNQFIVRKLLRSGDVFLDFGANFGIYTLIASRIVGDRGQVHAFEPQPRLVEIIKAQLVFNNISNVKVHPVGVGDETIDLVLRNPVDHHTGTATLREEMKEGIEVGRVQVVRADDVLGDVPSSARVFAKIDVEGFEYKALKGLQKLLSNPKIAVLVEITDNWLNEMGTSAAAVYDMMKNYGFEAYEISRSSLTDFKIEPAKGVPKHQHDGLFMKPGFIDTL